MNPVRFSTFAALRHRNFRLFYTGQMISLTGSWMQSVAFSWLVLVLTNSAFYLGLVGALQTLPVLLFSFLGRGGGRPHLQTPAALHHPGRPHAPGPGVGGAGGSQPGPDLDALRPGLSVGHRHGLRHPGAPGLHRGPGGQAGPAQRHRPQLHPVQRHPGGGAGGGGRDHRRGGHGQLLLPECRLLSGGAPGPGAHEAAPHRSRALETLPPGLEGAVGLPAGPPGTEAYPAAHDLGGGPGHAVLCAAAHPGPGHPGGGSPGLRAPHGHERPGGLCWGASPWPGGCNAARPCLRSWRARACFSWG